nr:PREDICTED: venom protease-like [Bemisia tabaci]
MHLLFGLCFLPLLSATLPPTRPSQNFKIEELGDEETARDSVRGDVRKRQAQAIDFQECAAPNNRTGHCRHLEDCLIPEYTETYRENIKHFCVIDVKNALYAGVCCPDDTASKTLSTRQILSRESPIDSRIVNSAQSNLAQSNLCGSNGKKTDRINAGEANYNDWPWMVALMQYKKFKRSWVHFCGAVLITETHVISAAHCFNTLKWQDIMVRIGAYNFKKANEFPYTDYKVRAAKIHEDYDKATNENDLIILSLERPVKFNKMVRPVCLPSPQSEDVTTLVNRTAVVAGWGATSFGGPASSTLLEVSVPIWEHEFCKGQLTQVIHDTTICASAYEGGRDACQGDSGGPLFFQRTDGRWTSIGVVSWGVGCAAKGKPGVYTRLTSYLPWIAQAQKEMGVFTS